VSKLRFNITISLDGYVAGPNQSVENPLGEGAFHIHDWALPTKTFRSLHGDISGGETGINDDVLREGFENIGATIMGRNMFGPIRGPWEDESWTGWWGDNPPYHHDTFVHTHYARPSVPMEGGTTFHFTDEPVDVVLERALKAANGKDVIIAGGASTIQQYLRAGLIDELHILVAPILAGAGERLFDNVAEALGNYKVTKMVSSPKATHLEIVHR
jgi:dihydrofolate reductase